MSAYASRSLLAVSALLLAAGGAKHAAAFGRAEQAVGASNIAPFFATSLKMLWLGDSAMMFVLALICAILAIRPHLASRTLLLLLALFPASTAVLLYLYFGFFMPTWLMLAIACGIALAAVLSTEPFAPNPAKGVSQ